MTVSNERTMGYPIPKLLVEDALDVIEFLRDRPVYLFLDYDGTLSPIVPDPLEAHLSRDMMSVLLELTKLYPVSIVTGRGRDCVSAFLGPELLSRVSIAASHGFDIHLKSGKYLHTGDTSHISQFRHFKTELRDSLGKFPKGICIEETGYSVSIHYRHVDNSQHHRVEEVLDEMLRSYPGLHKCGGKKVFEARLDVDWDKGRAVEWILDQTSADIQNGCVIYLGDDVTDEDAFRSLKQYKHHMCVIVADGEDIGRPTLAEYCLRDQDQVIKFLQHLIRLKF